MKTKFSVITDFIITELLLFVIVFIWVRFYMSKLWLCIILTLIITLCISVVLNILTRKKRTNKTTSREREEKKANTLNQFLYNDNAFALDFFAAMLTPKRKVDKENGFIIIDEEIILFCRISLSALSSNDLCGMITAARRQNCYKIAVLSHTLSKDLFKIINMFPEFMIDLYDGELVYSLMEKFNTFPEMKINIKKTKPGFRDALPLIFNRSKVKGYLPAALLMFTSSFFMPYSIYYTVMSGVLFLMTILSYKEVFTKRVNRPEKLI